MSDLPLTLRKAALQSYDSSYWGIIWYSALQRHSQKVVAKCNTSEHWEVGQVPSTSLGSALILMQGIMRRIAVPEDKPTRCPANSSTATG